MLVGRCSWSVLPLLAFSKDAVSFSFPCRYQIIPVCWGTRPRQPPCAIFCLYGSPMHTTKFAAEHAAGTLQVAQGDVITQGVAAQPSLHGMHLQAWHAVGHWTQKRAQASQQRASDLMPQVENSEMSWLSSSHLETRVPYKIASRSESLQSEPNFAV